MTDVRGWAEVEAWLREAHPEDTHYEPLHVFSKYFSELPDPLSRIVGECLTPEQRSRKAIVRERRRRYAATEPEQLSIQVQRVADPSRWRRTVGTGQDEEVEELELESELRHDAHVERERPVDASASSEPASEAELRSETALQEPNPLSSTDPASHLTDLHRKYLDAIDADGAEEPTDRALLEEFRQAILARFVRGLVPASYACDYDERWDAHAHDLDNERMREEAWFDDE